LIGGALWVFAFLGSHAVTAAFGKWPEWKNVLFFGFTKMTFALGGFMMVFAAFYSDNQFMR